jgi:TonB-dependent receptor-like protein
LSASALRQAKAASAWRSSQWFSSWRGRAVEVTGGTQARNDQIGLRLLNTHARNPVEKRDDFGRVIPAQVYDNHINQTNVSPYGDAQVRWTPWLRTVVGLRADLFHVHVESDRSANSGSVAAVALSPKLGIVLGPWQRTEFYANAGGGYHSNHANGAVQRVDPATGSPTHDDGQPVRPTDLVVPTRGAEVGMRTLLVANLQSSMSVWMIDSESELVYAPEAGFTQPERPGRRYGIEWNNFYRLRPWLVLDADAAWSHARYRVDPLVRRHHLLLSDPHSRPARRRDAGSRAAAGLRDASRRATDRASQAACALLRARDPDVIEAVILRSCAAAARQPVAVAATRPVFWPANLESLERRRRHA